MSDFVGQAVGHRMTGGTPSRVRSVGAAMAIGFGAALLAYRLLRSKPKDGSDQAPEQAADADDDSLEQAEDAGEQAPDRAAETS